MFLYFNLANYTYKTDLYTKSKITINYKKDLLIDNRFMNLENTCSSLNKIKIFNYIGINEKENSRISKFKYNNGIISKIYELFFPY